VTRIVGFIDEHRDEHGVEPICTILTEAEVPIAVSTYYAARSRPASARTLRDAELDARIRQVHADNYGVYGYRKVWKVLNRQDPEHPVARCTVARRMRALGLHGALPARSIRTTRPRPADVRPEDLVTPSRWPASISAWITQRRTDSFPTPTCLAAAAAAAVRFGYSPRCWLTRRTARAFSSGSIFFGMLLILLDSNRSDIKPGALQLEAIVTNLPDKYGLLVLLAAWCALRYGELAELRRSDVDLERGVIHVRRGVVRMTGEVIVGTPKTRAGVRDVAIPHTSCPPSSRT